MQFVTFLSSRVRVLLWSLVGVATLLRIPLCCTPLAYKSDVWRQADTASIAHHFYHYGFKLWYPQVFWGGAGPGFVETEFQLYPFLTALLYLPWGEQLWLGRLVSLLFSVGTLGFFYLLARRLAGRDVALSGLFFLAISPLFVRYSVAFMPDATVLFFYTATLYFFHRSLEEGRVRDWAFTSLSLTLALLVKPTSLHIGLVLLSWSIARQGWQVLRRRALWMTALSSLVLPTLWFLHARSLFLKYGNTFGLFSGGDSKFGRLSDWTYPKVYMSLFGLEFEWVFAGGGLVLALFGLKLAWKQCKHPLLSGWLVLFLYYMLLARYTQQSWGIQYHIYALPYAALLVGLGVRELAQPALWKRGVLVVGVLGTLFVAGWSYAGMLGTPQDPRMKCARVVRSVVPKRARVVVLSSSEAIDYGVPNNYQDPFVFFYSRRYGWSLPLDRWHVRYLQPKTKRGASYLVVPQPKLLRRFLSFQSYLKTQRKIRVPAEARCHIYKLQ
ncbi:MAG: glycosyltransferase family 39 protein [Deltaproteobacteria bacterium]|nr:MAG: glycosyltransferase family 39 protein [Deltaproteobacteria bacterium]